MEETLSKGKLGKIKNNRGREISSRSPNESQHRSSNNRIYGNIKCNRRTAGHLTNENRSPDSLAFPVRAILRHWSTVLELTIMKPQGQGNDKHPPELSLRQFKDPPTLQ